MKSSSVGMVVTALALILAAIPARAQDQDRIRDRDRVHQTLTPDQDRDRLRLRDRIHQDAQLTEPELAAIDGELAEYARRRGDPNALRETVREAVRTGCKGECLAECIRLTNMTMQRGATGEQAGEMVRAALRDQERARVQARAATPHDPQQLRERVQARLTQHEESRVGERDRDGAANRDRDRDRERDRDRDRDRDPDRDRDRDRERDRDRVRDPAMGTGGAGPRR